MKGVENMNHLTIQHLPELPFDVEESINQLRVNLGFCGDQIKTVVITSSIPNEGKSFIAVYLWKMLAELGSRVLLIDCDLRKSEMRTKYGISSAEKITGIAHYLAGKVELQDAVYETNIPNGYMIPLSAPVANPAIRRWKASPTRCTLRPTRTAPSWWCAAAGLPASWWRMQWTS